MKTLFFITSFSTLLLSSATFAQGPTQGNVQQQLIQAQDNQAGLVTTTSQQRVERIYDDRTMQGTYNGAPSGSQRSGGRKILPSSVDNCVGPVSFCNIYAGS
jgi:hypothetical protein